MTSETPASMPGPHAPEPGNSVGDGSAPNWFTGDPHEGWEDLPCGCGVPRCGGHSDQPDEALSAFDLRLRSLDRKQGEPINLCSECLGSVTASWSVWLHTPEWGEQGGDTRVLCTHHALKRISVEARRGR